jgi:NAD(P)-dependent dehydrogenase (short-subunit alcohol dehydrogenase family)
MPQIKQVALITGANKGIGFEVARQLGQRGIIVLVGARDGERGKEAARTLQTEGIDAHGVQLDVTDQASVDAAAATIDATYGKLDILVNNAGISVREQGTPPSALDLSDLRRTYETNFFGAFAVTKAMLPLLRRAEAGRIVNQSSNMGSLAFNSDPDSVYSKMPPLLAYCSSKTAMNALTVFFARELRDTPIKINAVNPGYCATDLNDHSGFLTAAQGAEAAVHYATIGADGPTGGFFEAEGTVPW